MISDNFVICLLYVVNRNMIKGVPRSEARSGLKVEHDRDSLNKMDFSTFSFSGTNVGNFPMGQKSNS